MDLLSKLRQELKRHNVSFATKLCQPNKMKRHFDTKHPNFAGKDVQYLKNKAVGVKKSRLDFGCKYQQQKHDSH